MNLWILLACTEPPLLDSVASSLADGALADGGPGLQMMTAVTGLIAEACTAGDVDGYTFVGPLAGALGITAAEVTGNDDATVTWTFVDAGLGDALGTLTVTTDQDMSQLAVGWSGAAALFGAGLETAACDVSTGALLTGQGSWQTNGASSTITLLGVAPSVGIGYAAAPAPAPTSGQLRSSSDRDGWSVLLDEAGTIDATTGAWEGTASGSDWTHAISLALP